MEFLYSDGESDYKCVEVEGEVDEGRGFIIFLLMINWWLKEIIKRKRVFVRFWYL